MASFYRRIPFGHVNLFREGIPDSSSHVTGNTVIDALLHVAAREVRVGVNLDAGSCRS